MPAEHHGSCQDEGGKTDGDGEQPAAEGELGELPERVLDEPRQRGLEHHLASREPATEPGKVSAHVRRPHPGDDGYGKADAAAQASGRWRNRR